MISMKTISASGIGSSSSIDDLRMIFVSFLAWGVVFGFGVWIIGRQISKINPSSTFLGPVDSAILGLGAFLLMMAVHFIQAKMLRNSPQYSVKFLALPGLFILFELVIFGVLRL